MEWSDDAIVLGSKRHGDAHSVLTVLAHHHGRHLGLVHGGASRRLMPILQPGNGVRVTWRARLSDQLGSFHVELDRDRASAALYNPDALLGLLAACTIASEALAEREPVPAVYEGMAVLLDAFESPDLWPALMVRWELGLLEVLGFGLDLSRCAVTGTRDDLTHVSPRSGRAVCREAARPYLHKLLALPPFLLGSQTGTPSPRDIADGLSLTGRFLADSIFGLKGQPLPDARARLGRRFADLAEKAETTQM